MHPHLPWSMSLDLVLIHTEGTVYHSSHQSYKLASSRKSIFCLQKLEDKPCENRFGIIYRVFSLCIKAVDRFLFPSIPHVIFLQAKQNADQHYHSKDNKE